MNQMCLFSEMIMNQGDEEAYIITNIVDTSDPEANMYGCVPCPICNSEFRWPTTNKHPTNPNQIVCDNCGFNEYIGDILS